MISLEIAQIVIESVGVQNHETMCLKRLRLGTKANGQLRSCFAHGVSQHLPNESLSIANFALQKYLLQSLPRNTKTPRSSQLG